MATYTKLKDGSWGVRGTGLTAGATVTVTKRDGSTKTETVAKVLWTGDGISIAAIVPTPRPGGGSSGRRAAGCAACGRGGRLVEDLEDGLMKHYSCCDIPPAGGY